jgi:8-oxo-dGTP pyrophosphatase MutT (NUDIX family)
MSLSAVVRAFVFNPDGQILMVQHKPGLPWALPGGHVESGESIHDAMTRELREEFSLDARFFEMDRDEILRHRGKKLTHHPLPISIYDLSYVDKNGKDKSRTEYIFLMETDSEIGAIQTEEIHDHKWFDADNIITMKPNIETWDFVIEMLERIIDSGDEE